ncbi:MAG: hypothetical protein ACPF9D_06485 [Owenweeksia sp.]
MRALLFLILLSACGSQPKGQVPKAEKAEYEKTITGYSGAKQVSFYLEMLTDSATQINRFMINGEELEFTASYHADRYYIRAEKVYRNPQRDPASEISESEFNTAPLYQARTHEAAVYYTLSSGDKSAVKISEWQQKKVREHP